MAVATTCKELDIDDALHLVDDGAAFVDLRPTSDYLEVHIPGSLALLWEFGPGMAGRARDVLPLSLPFVLCDENTVDATHAANALRGKGFTVLGKVSDAVNGWASSASATPASTEVITGAARPQGTLLDVGDPGVRGDSEPDLHIPLEGLWNRAQELDSSNRVVVVAGYGVRAAVAVGILERHGAQDVAFWRTRN
jgi:rhodanese-related sulfurtransferase